MQGEATRLLTTRLQDCALAPFRNDEEILQLLEDVYANPFRPKTAQRAFVALEMGFNQTCEEFITRFKYLRAESDSYGRG